MKYIAQHFKDKLKQSLLNEIAHQTDKERY